MSIASDSQMKSAIANSCALAHCSPPELTPSRTRSNGVHAISDSGEVILSGASHAEVATKMAEKERLEGTKISYSFYAPTR